MQTHIRRWATCAERFPGRSARRTHSDAGQAIADGIEARSRWIVVPPWARALLVLRTALGPLLERRGADAAEADALFQADVERRGAEAASRPLGPGGAAAVSAKETPAPEPAEHV